MKIEVFGTGCAKCQNVENAVKKYVADHGINASVEKVSDITQIMKRGIASTPAVAIDGVVKSTGRIPSEEEMAAWF